MKSFSFSAIVFLRKCSPLSRILLSTTLLLFYPTDFGLQPCQEVCFAVYATCHNLFTTHGQQWPAHLTCSSFLSSPSLCLLPASYLHHFPRSNTSKNTSSFSKQSSKIFESRTSSTLNHSDFTSSH